MLSGHAQFLAAVAAGIYGAIAHEGTHYLVARGRGYDAEIDWEALECTWSQPVEDTLGYRAIAGAPLGVGLTAALGLLLAGVTAWYVWLGLAVYTLGGVRSDGVRVLSGPRADVDSS